MGPKRKKNGQFISNKSKKKATSTATAAAAEVFNEQNDGDYLGRVRNDSGSRSVYDLAG